MQKRPAKLLAKPKPITTINSIQFMRAVACLMVVVHHALSLAGNSTAAVGAAGVDIFFVISGFVMVVATKENETSGLFIKKRIIKVVPMYWIATAITVAFYYTRHGDLIVWNHIVTSLFFLPPPEHLIVPVLYPGWSLNYEIFFYLLIAFALLFNRNTFLYVLIFVSILGAVGHKTGVYFIDYYLNDVLIEFGSGILIGLAYKNKFSLPPMTGAFLLAGSVILFSINYTYPTISKAIYWGVPSVMAIAGILAFEKTSLINNKVGLEIGAASYSMYLFHPFIIWAIEWRYGNEPGVIFALSAILISVALSWVIYRLVEAPLNKGLRKLTISSVRANGGNRCPHCQ